MSGKVKSALIYPIFLLGLAVVVVAVIMIVVMPKFSQIFASMDMELPAMTQVLINISNFVAAKWWLLLGLFAVAALAFRFYAKSEKGGLQLAKLALKIPVLGKVNAMKAASQFANTMSTLLTAGIPIINATEIVSRVIDNLLIRLEISKLIPKLEAGNRLGDEMKKCECLPSMLCEMTAVGEDTGTMESILEVIGEYYDRETANASEKAVNFLQPAMTVVIGIIIGVIVIALYLPIFSMNDGI